MDNVPKLFTAPTTDYTVVYAFVAFVGLILFVIIYAIIAKIKGWEVPPPQKTTKDKQHDHDIGILPCMTAGEIKTGIVGYPSDDD